MAVDFSRYYEPHEGQRRIHASTVREKYVEAARRFGKGRAGFGEFYLVYQEVSLRDLAVIQRYKLVPPGIHAWFVVPTFPQGRQMWNEMMEFIPREMLLGAPDRANWIMYLKGPTPDIWGEIEVKSAHDPDSLQTVGLDFLWVSESQDIRLEALNKLRPTLVQPGRTGRAYFEGIPASWPDHWFWRGCAAAEAKRLRNAEHFHFTVYDNPLLTPEQLLEIEGFREIMPEAAWRRMYLAERTLSSGFFKNVEQCLLGNLLTEPVPGTSYVAGLDLGVSRDYTVLDIMDADRRTLDFHRLWDGVPWPDVKAQIVHICRHWGVQRLLPDATGQGKAMCQELQAEGLAVEGGVDGQGVILSGQTRHDLLARLQLAIETETVHFPNIPSLLRQLHAFQYLVTTGRGYMRSTGPHLGAPPGEHDDEVFALALALSACNDPVDNTVGKRVLSQGRYVPTTAEMNGAVMGFGAELMARRKSERRAARYQRAGIATPLRGRFDR